MYRTSSDGTVVVVVDVLGGPSKLADGVGTVGLWIDRYSMWYE
jgi:hypothetical protein